jgi:hypothetical protein
MAALRPMLAAGYPPPTIFHHRKPLPGSQGMKKGTRESVIGRSSKTFRKKIIPAANGGDDLSGAFMNHRRRPMLH